ncbi:MAG: DUF1289 domain-containing protein [Betaproteobacteria bacterium]|nr:DUF1289 domain-containing protein [Betaproteobacteria bacterium]
MPVESPCIKVCVMDEVTGLCRGCLRTLDEIAWWSGMSDHEKRDVLARLEARRSQCEG